MCGIVGKVYVEPGRPVDGDLIARMKHCIRHRGPDDDGTHLRAPAGFGFQRLSIIDLKTGHQPIYNEDDSVVIVFNGEIYNFQELRERLIKLGHVFKTRADTETILHGYEEWGTNIASELRGMFAFAIFDHKNNSLFLARDRTGKKPLYYTHIRRGGPDEALLFASEMKALLADPDVPRNVDISALNHYLSYQYVPHPLSIFEGIKKLPPGSWMHFQNGVEKVERYWRLQYEPKYEVSEERAIEELTARLDEAVKVRLLSEVPLGCFLSGGIDSSAVVAMMRRHIAGDLKTFSIGFREEAFNELPYARQVAEKFETHHEEFIVEPNAIECIGALAWHFDEPFADSSAIPTYYLSKMTRQFVTVALNGDGGDESFAGYARYRGMPVLHKYRRIPKLLRAAAAGPFDIAAEAFSRNAKAELLSYVNRMSLMSEERQYIQCMVFFREYQKSRLFSEKYQNFLNESDADSEGLTESLMRDGTAREMVDKMMYSDIMMYLPGALLPKVDRTTMANSLEGRSPFLDHHLMEFAAKLPGELKFPNRELKGLLKKALAPIFGMEFLNRPKQGFGVPIGEWFRGDLRKLTEDFLFSEKARQRGFFDHKYIRRIFDQHVTHQQNHTHRIWALLMFEAWCRTLLDRSDPLAGPISLG
ncbi:MAG: asparagine synthase (glutamine-hydrolyzing) [Candidatus Sumerlaeaceae bacterium]|nr:asparagine synthase (glutamine-hydrolyzing) [Candidatus Sumerlaeaceae bacterium]